MGKKLVKTAQQQFEERLRELNVTITYKVCEDEIYYLCEDSKANVYILREIGIDEEYKELAYGMQYEALVFSERFLSMMTERFAEHSIKVKPLFDWYASADHDNEPFSLFDIFMCELEESHFTFEDIYEDIPDTRFITAREQFERRLEEVGLLQAWFDQCSLGRIGIVDKETKRILVFVHEDCSDGYTEFVYPPFEELRKDSVFCLECLGELVDNCDDAFFKAVSLWIHKGGNCPLGPVDVYFSANHLRLDETTDFKDKEIPQEQPIKKIDFSTEITDLKERMIAHIKELYEHGTELDSDFFLSNACSITWSDGSYYACENLKSCKLAKDDEGALCFCETQKNDKDVSYDSPLSILTINTLWSIINAMR